MANKTKNKSQQVCLLWPREKALNVVPASLRAKQVVRCHMRTSLPLINLL